MLSFLSLGLLTAPTHAQTSHSWKVTYTNTPPDSTYSYDLTTGQHVSGTWTPSTSGYGLSGGFRNGSISGFVTAKLTWIPASGQTLASDPPPDPVSIIEYGYAREDSLLGTDPSNHGPAGSASDGLGDAPVVSGNGYVSSGYHVVSKSPNASGVIVLPMVTLSAVNPTYSQTTGYPSYTRWPTGQTSVNFAVYPVMLNLSGTTKGPGGDNILIGQGCTGSLSASPATLSNFQWSPGPVFDQFLIASDQSMGHATFLSATALAQPSPTWRYLQDSGAGTFSVTCSATASVNGTAIGTVTGKRSVKVWVPYYYLNHNTGLTGVYQSTPPAGPYDHVSTGAANLAPPGMNFIGAVGTPALFSASGAGSWLFVQLINTVHNQWYPLSPIPTQSGSNGLALDNQWPYTPGWPANSTDVSPTPQSADDSPDMYLISGYNKFAIEDVYKMYMMYLPPGASSQYVPLHLLTWNWNAGPVTINSNGLWPSGAAGTVSVTSDVRCIDHPSWTQKYP